MSAAFVTVGGIDRTFDGIEWDLELTPDRNIKWRDPIGGSPKAVPLWMDLPSVDASEMDMADMTFTLWAHSTQAQAIEENVQAFAPGMAFDLYTPGLSSTPSVPGFANWNAGRKCWKLQNCTLNQPIESMGRKAPRVDLFGYRFNVHFSAHGGGTNANERGQVPVTSSYPGTELPAFIAKKFAAHQMQDWSRIAKPMPTQGWTSFAGVKHGLRRDATIAIDHVDGLTADTVCNWYRVARGGVVTLTLPGGFGPGITYTTNCVVRNLTIRRGAGWWWDLSLDLSQVVNY